MTMHDESRAMAAFLEGALAMDMQKQINAPDRLLKVAEVKIDTDLEGNYDPTFVVVFESGAQVSVTVLPHDPDAEVDQAIRSIKGE